MELSVRLGIAGVLLALVGTAITILWPEKRWIGWLCLFFAAVGLIVWLTAEIHARLEPRSAKAVSALLVLAVLGILVTIYWISPKPKKETHSSEAPKQPPEQQKKESQHIPQTSPQFGPLDPLANLTNVRLDDMVQANVQRLRGAGGRWCMGDFQIEGAKRELLRHSTHRDGQGNITPASKQELAAIEKSKNSAEKKYDAEQVTDYRDIAREASSLERELLHRLHSSEKQGILPDKATGDVFVRFANAKYSCRDFEKASDYLGTLVQQFEQYNPIQH